MDRADQVWNRAALGQSAARLAGDRALAAMLAAHGLVMNGGALHAVEVLSESELKAAVRGYSFYAQHNAAAGLRDAAACLRLANPDEFDTREAELHAAYAEAVKDDDALKAVFTTHFLAHPELYADS